MIAFSSPVIVIDSNEAGFWVIRKAFRIFKAYCLGTLIVESDSFSVISWINDKGVQVLLDPPSARDVEI